MINKYILLLLAIITFSCNNKQDTEIINNDTNQLFSVVNSSDSNITFNNKVIENYEFNFLNYPYIYIGAGVAVGDINNDGLQDIYFTSNQGSNKLYLNQGDFKFKDITVSAKVTDSLGWSSGVSMIDINNDGWLDIYVCKSAALENKELRRNKLFINQKNNTFKEASKSYGLDHIGFSTQAYFFDYDNDYDLDMYLVNHRFDFRNNGKISSVIQRDIQEETSDQLFKNNGDNTFTKVTQEAGISNKSWGLSAAIGDYNNDGWQDVYVANDYLEPDMLYINNKNGTFKNEILERFNHISFNSMGSDYADINNDMLPDLLVLDMLAEDHSRGKENMATMSTSNFNAMVSIGYHHQYMSNMLQFNNGDGTYSEIGQLSGITKTDWSWAPLIADFDNDGYKDVFITNGIEKDLGNQDFRNEMAVLNKQGVSMSLDSVLSIMPSAKLANYVFKNNGDLTFTNKVKDWGLGEKINSNGATYADLDNDGDLDLITNNENDIASLYKNNSTNKYVNIKLKGRENNINAIGAKVKVITKNTSQYQEIQSARGFLSSVSYVLNFGINQDNVIDKIEVTWPDNMVSIVTNLKANQTIEIDYKTEKLKTLTTINNQKPSYFEAINPVLLNINYRHKENNFNDYSKQLLLPQKQSTQGPCIGVADVNGDNFDDFYVGGALNQEAELYLQNASGTFKKQNTIAFIKDKGFEDANALFFDADNDNDLDLYVSSSGYELEENNALLQDRLYINDGNGNFNRSSNLPKMLTSTKAVKAVDFDLDNDLDLIIAGRVVPGQYPLAPQSYVLENNNGKFTDVTQTVAPEFSDLGMINAIEVIDINNDGNKDVIVAGLWMPITLFTIKEGKLIKQEIPEFEKTEGWYQSIAASDFDKDGDIDFIIGNMGANNKFHPTLEKPLHIFSGNFDDNNSYDIALSKTYNGQLVPVRGKECSSQQTPFLNDKIESYKKFASLNIEGVYGSETISKSNHLVAYNFKSLFVENLGKGNFKLHLLPNQAQFSVTQDFAIMDVNNDGIKDLIGVGNLYDAEVETVRFDASRGYVLTANNDAKFKSLWESGINCNKDMRSIETINISGKPHIIIANNNDELSIYKHVK
jgi:hypothetical protein